MNFTLTQEQISRIYEWVEEENKIAIKKQKIAILPDNPDYDTYKYYWDYDQPYSGAVGVSPTFSFTITSIGIIIKITHPHTNSVLDITEYDMW